MFCNNLLKNIKKTIKLVNVEKTLVNRNNVCYNKISIWFFSLILERDAKYEKISVLGF